MSVCCLSEGGAVLVCNRWSRLLPESKTGREDGSVGQVFTICVCACVLYRDDDDKTVRKKNTSTQTITSM